jgi:hypothetical protein
MTLVKASHIKGTIIEGKETFASIPGLIMWCETDFGVTLSGSDIVSIGDRSGNGNAIIATLNSRRAQLVSIGGGFSAMQNLSGGRFSNLFNAASKGWNPIMKQQPFGIFTLCGFKASVTSLILRHLGDEANKMWLGVTANGAVRHIFRNSDNTETDWGSANNAVILDNNAPIHAIDLISYGSGNNPRLELFVNTSSVATLATSNVTGSETAGRSFRVLETTQSGQISRLVILLVYDWTGYSVAQINSFRQRINNLREEKYGSIF